MPAYNESLDLLDTFGTQWQPTPGLDMDAEIAALKPRSRRSGTSGGQLDPMTGPPASRVRRRPSPAARGLAWRRRALGLLFISPWIIGFLRSRCCR